jgi:hypothetical protein
MSTYDDMRIKSLDKVDVKECHEITFYSLFFFVSFLLIRMQFDLKEKKSANRIITYNHILKT